jgi:hypothetical protein
MCIRTAFTEVSLVTQMKFTHMQLKQGKKHKPKCILGLLTR